MCLPLFLLPSPALPVQLQREALCMLLSLEESASLQEVIAAYEERMDEFR